MFGGDADLEPVKVDVGCGLVWARIPDMLEPLPGLSWKPQPGICYSPRGRSVGGAGEGFQPCDPGQMIRVWRFSGFSPTVFTAIKLFISFLFL